MLVCFLLQISSRTWQSTLLTRERDGRSGIEAGADFATHLPSVSGVKQSGLDPTNQLS